MNQNDELEFLSELHAEEYISKLPIEKPLKELPENIKKEIEENPHYFIYQGGSDGTFAHSRYLDDYGEWKREATDYAAKILKEKGLDW